MSIQQERIARGQCPQCGKEAAPYYLCWSCRLKPRVMRAMRRARDHGILASEGKGKEERWSMGPKDDPETIRLSDRWATPINLPETDRRGQPRLKGIRVDVERILVEIIRYMNRGVTIEEILEAWGKLRSKRSSPLASDLASIIAAQDKRAKKNAKRAALATFVEER